MRTVRLTKNDKGLASEIKFPHIDNQDQIQLSAINHDSINTAYSF